jgi:nicotinamide-nucleotide amidase
MGATSLKAEILCIGTELLMGETVNTNATYIATALNNIGVDVLWVTAVGDNPGRMSSAYALARSRVNLVLVTGGLGPTPDDLSTEVLARFLERELVESPEARAHIDQFFAERGRIPTANNYKQTLFPEGATLLPNPTGTAWGFKVTDGAASFYLMPGVPREMKYLMTTHVLPDLQKSNPVYLESHLLHFAGIGESALVSLPEVAPLLLETDPTVAPYAHEGSVSLRVATKGDSPSHRAEKLAPIIKQLQGLSFYYGQGDETLAQVVIGQLKTQNYTLSVCESCTGGYLSSSLTDVSGASSVFKGGMVAYGLDIKQENLGLSKAIVDDNQAVNAQVSEELAKAAKTHFKTDVGIGVTGFLAPHDDASQLGNVFFSVDTPHGITTKQIQLGSGWDRRTMKERLVMTILDVVRRELMT